MLVKYANRILVVSLPYTGNKYIFFSLSPEYLIYLRLFQTLDTVDAAKAFIEDNKIAVIGFFKVHILIFYL
jgi:hypothetical protein